MNGAAAPSAPSRRPHSTRLQRVAEPRCGYSPGSSPPASPTVRELPYLEEPPELARSFGGSGAGAAVDGRPTAAARVWVAATRPQYPNGVYRALATVSRSSAARRTTWPSPRGPRRPVSLAAKTSATWFERSGSLAPGGPCHTAYRKSCYYPTQIGACGEKVGPRSSFRKGGGPSGEPLRHAVPIGREHPRRLNNPVPPVPRRTDWPSRWPPPTPPAPPPAT